MFLTLLPACLALWSLSPAPAAQAAAQPVRVERRLGAMGTWLTLQVEARSRSEALAASEAAARAVEATEARLSTWRADSELAQLNRCAPQQAFELSSELAGELQIAREVFERTGGAFDPSVGGLVQAWGLRSGGRRPSVDERERARVPGGLASLRLESGRAWRSHPGLILEEGGFGKGAGLDAAVEVLRGLGVQAAVLDLGGQVAVLGDGRRTFEWDVADPRQREVAVVRLELRTGSLATSGNSERGIVVDGERLGHLLDPRSAAPAPDFGSLTVWAPDATRADAFSTGLFVLGPDAALEFARSAPDIDVLVLAVQADGTLSARATGCLAACARALDARVRFPASDPGDPAPAPETRPSSSVDSGALHALPPRQTLP